MLNELEVSSKKLSATSPQPEPTSSVPNTRGSKWKLMLIPLSSPEFFQKIGKGKVWIQFCYERLVEFCYNCGLLGHRKSSCKQPLVNNQLLKEDLYGPWMRAEVDAFTVVAAGPRLRRVEIPRREIFNAFEKEMNTDARAEIYKAEDNEDDIGEEEPDLVRQDKLTEPQVRVEDHNPNSDTSHQESPITLRQACEGHGQSDKAQSSSDNGMSGAGFIFSNLASKEFSFGLDPRASITKESIRRPKNTTLNHLVLKRKATSLGPEEPFKAFKMDVGAASKLPQACLVGRGSISKTILLSKYPFDRPRKFPIFPFLRTTKGEIESCS